MNTLANLTVVSWMFAFFAQENASAADNASGATIGAAMFVFDARLKEPNQKDQTTYTNSLNNLGATIGQESPMTYSNGVWFYVFKSTDLPEVSEREQKERYSEIAALAIDPTVVGTVKFDGMKFNITRGYVMNMYSPMDDKSRIEIDMIQAERLELGNRWYLSQGDGLGIHLYGIASKHDPTLAINPKGDDRAEMKFNWKF